MNVEAICPHCQNRHVVSAKMRGVAFRCAACHADFLVSRTAKETDQRAPHDPAPDRTRGAMQAGIPVLRPGAPDRPDAGDRKDRPHKPAQESVEDLLRLRLQRRPGLLLGLGIGLGIGVVLLIGLLGAGAWWLFAGHKDKEADLRPQAQAAAPADLPPKDEPPRAANKDEPPRAANPPRDFPFKPVAWKVRIDPPPIPPVKLPADFKKDVAVPALHTQAIFPRATWSPVVAVGNNAANGESREIWDLQNDRKINTLEGRFLPSREILSPDGAYLIRIPIRLRAIMDIWSLKTGQQLFLIDLAKDFNPELSEFTAPGKLMTVRATVGLTFDVWNLETVQHELTIHGPVRNAMSDRESMAVSPGGGYVAVMTRYALLLYSLTTGELAGQITLGNEGDRQIYLSWGMSFSPDGSELAALVPVGREWHVFCWDMRNGTLVADVAPVPPGTAIEGSIRYYYTGRIFDWLPDRKGWLLYGEIFVDRKRGGPAVAPPVLKAGGPPVRHLIGFDHVATLPAGLGGQKVLSVGRFDLNQLK